MPSAFYLEFWYNPRCPYGVRSICLGLTPADNRGVRICFVTPDPLRLGPSQAGHHYRARPTATPESCRVPQEQCGPHDQRCEKGTPDRPEAEEE